jgi:hypothetical protein
MLSENDRYSGENVEQDHDVELEKIMANLLVSENQEDRLQRTLSDRFDKYHPLAFSQDYSDYAFKHRDRSFRISIKLEQMTDTKNLQKKRSHEAQARMLMPMIGIISLFFLVAVVIIFVNNVYFGGNEQVASFLAHEESVAQIVEKCGSNAILKEPYSRLSVSLYAECDKQIKQIQEYCKTHAMDICQDERIDRYLLVRRLLP